MKEWGSQPSDSTSKQHMGPRAPAQYPALFIWPFSWGCRAVQFASNSPESFLVSGIQLVGLQISPLRNLSVKKEPAGFGWVGVWRILWPPKRKVLELSWFLQPCPHPWSLSFMLGCRGGVR